MKIYEIEAEIERLLTESVDEETGEVLFDPAALEALEMERDTKIENLALAYKNLLAEAKAIEEEKKVLDARCKSTKKAAERAAQYLEFVLKGETFKTAKVAVTYRKSSSVKLADGFVEWAMVHAPDYLRYKLPEADKTAIGNALKKGEDIFGAYIEHKETMIIK